MKRLHIFNPAAGKGHSPELLKLANTENERMYVTTGVGDAERAVFEALSEHPETHIAVYGGDGTINEVVNGIMRAGAGKSALMSIVPAGTGNDLVRSFDGSGEIKEIDLLKYNGRYAANTINIGFDHNVVEKAASYKRLPLVGGSAAYILGVADVFLHKMGQAWEIEAEDATGEVEHFSGERLLCLFANGSYYGGGFKSAPLAKLDDGLLDFILVDKMSRPKFVSLVGSYKKGTHIDPETRQPIVKFKNFMHFKQCKKIKISGITKICVDGETEHCTETEITVEPRAIKVVM